jgi:hypothetical protein
MTRVRVGHPQQAVRDYWSRTETDFWQLLNGDLALDVWGALLNRTSLDIFDAAIADIGLGNLQRIAKARSGLLRHNGGARKALDK